MADNTLTAQCTASPPGYAWWLFHPEPGAVQKGCCDFLGFPAGGSTDVRAASINFSSLSLVRSPASFCAAIVGAGFSKIVRIVRESEVSDSSLAAFTKIRRQTAMRGLANAMSSGRIASTSAIVRRSATGALASASVSGAKDAAAAAAESPKRERRAIVMMGVSGKLFLL